MNGYSWSDTAEINEDVGQIVFAKLTSHVWLLLGIKPSITRASNLCEISFVWLPRQYKTLSYHLCTMAKVADTHTRMLCSYIKFNASEYT